MNRPVQSHTAKKFIWKFNQGYVEPSILIASYSPTRCPSTGLLQAVCFI